MNEQQLKNRLIEALQEARQPLTASELAQHLALRGKQRKKLQKWLHQLVKQGSVLVIRGNRYTLGSEADLVSGPLVVLRSGKGLLESDAHGTVRVPSDDQGTALPGDRVLVRLRAAEPEPRSTAAGRAAEPSGKVIKVLERARRDIVGTLRTTGRFFYVVPLDPAYQQDFYVSGAGDARPGDRVVIRFLDWPNRHVSPEAELLETLGPADNPSLDTLAVIRDFGLQETFAEDAIREAEAASSLMDDPGPRRNLTGRLVVTIDPERARDYDDAVSLWRDALGRRVLGVHIADVGHFVKPGSALDREARSRGNSVYFPDRVLPMLPEQLSNSICSLKPDSERLAFSVLLTMDGSGRVIDSSCFKSIIRSGRRLTYEQALEMLRTAPRRPSGSAGKADQHAVPLLLRELSVAAQQLRGSRLKCGALELDLPECEVLTAPDGTPQGARLVSSDEAHQLIEECMIAANEAVAQRLVREGVPLLSRLHEPPDPEHAEALTELLVELGYPKRDYGKRRALAALLKSMERDPLAYHVHTAVLKSMKRALYSATRHGHFGLAKTSYAHFTSPIRRYADLVVHRQLDTLLDKTNTLIPYRGDQLEAFAAHCNDGENRAELAERACLEIKKYRLLQAEASAEQPAVHEAVVVNVRNFGMFVERLDLQVQGLVHVSAISDAFVRYNRRKNTLRAGKQVYTVGCTVKIRVRSVDMDARKIDFELA